jgi:hypothetical protein
MKKLLGATTALVGLAALAASAQASEPVKLELGGYSYWYLGYADNNAANGSKFQGADIKGDNEIWFDGSTTLDNGMKVSAHVELEAGGHGDYTTDPIDESFVTVEAGFGKLIVGTTGNADKYLHVSAPDVGLGLSDGDYGYWIASPANWTSFREFTTTWGDRDDHAEKVMYFTPVFHGLTGGISYTPSVNTEDNRGAVVLSNGSPHNGLSLGLGYARELGDWTVAASAGYYHADVKGFSASQEFSAGLKIGYGAWTVGGSFRHSEEDDRLTSGTGVTTAGDGNAWDVGISYTTGPLGLSVGYMMSDAEAGVGNNYDVMRLWQASANYALGAGVALVGSIMYVDYKGAADTTARNDGVAAVSGIRLTF